MISFYGVVCVLLGDVAGGGQQLVEHARMRGSPVGGHLDRAYAVLQRAGEKLGKTGE